MLPKSQRHRLRVFSARPEAGLTDHIWDVEELLKFVMTLSNNANCNTTAFLCGAITQPDSLGAIPD